jgi:glycosyltransferase involved in cell wall biosynthesis
MRIAIISKTFVAETAQRQLEWLARQPGIEVVLVTPPTWHTDDGGVQAFCPTFAAGYDIVQTPIALNGHYHVYWYPELGRVLSAIRPDLVHSDEEPYNLATSQALWWAVEHKVPAVAVAWQNRLRYYPPPFSLMEQWVYRRVTTIIAGNEGAARVVRKKGYGGPLPTFALHGIDPVIWPAREMTPPAPDTPFTIGYVGRLTPEKGVDVLLSALTLLPPRCRLRVIGRGPAATPLAQQAALLGIADRVEWCEYTSPLAMPAAIRELDCLVLPSRTRANWSEQFGRVLIEAMASGVPVVGSDSGEIPTVIGEAGIIVPEDNAPLLAVNLTALVNDPAWWRDLAERGRARALTHFTQENVAEQLANVYRGLLAAKPRAYSFSRA